MPSSTTVASGAVYGTGVYGVDVYGAGSISVYINVDGNSASAILNDTLQIQGDALHAIVSIFENETIAFVGNVDVATGCTFEVTGVEGTTTAGAVSQVTVNRVSVTGLSADLEIGTITLETNNYIDVTGLSATGSIDNVLIFGDSNVSITGVFATGFINSTLVILENEVYTPPSVFLIGSITTPTVVTTIFNFNAVASLYDRRRTVFVPRRTTSAERTVYVSALPRIVYIDRRSNSNDRTLLAA